MSNAIRFFQNLSGICMISMLGPFISGAQTTDAAEKVAALLQEKGPVPVTSVINVGHQRTQCLGGGGEGGGGCRTVNYYTQQPVVNNQILTASNIRIVSHTDLTFGTPTRTELPKMMYVDDYFVQSCPGAPPVQANETLQKAFQRSASIQLSHTVAHTTGGNISLSLKVGGEQQNFTVGGELQFSTTDTTGTVTVDATQETVTRSKTLSVTIPTGTAAVLELQIWPVHLIYPFSATVVVDADISGNDENIKHLSDIYPDVSDRTFLISGTIDAADASAGRGTDYAVSLDQTICSGASQNVTKPHFDVPSEMKLRVRNH
jgi:hypothetical protein